MTTLETISNTETRSRLLCVCRASAVKNLLRRSGALSNRRDATNAEEGNFAFSGFGIRHSSFPLHGGFSLLELLVVLAIIGLLAAVALPNIKNFQPNVGANAARQLLGDVNHARQLAISQHTTVYMVFVPTNFWNDPLGPNPSAPASDPWATYFSRLPVGERSKASNLLSMQLVGYNYVTLHSLGDQPGHPTPRYLGSWRTLPDSAFIPLFKFNNPATPATPMFFYTNGNMVAVTNCFPFRATNNIPFPSEFNTNTATYISLPYIAFNYQGELVNGQGQVTYSNSCELIPLAKGNVVYGRDLVTRVAQASTPQVIENPAGNTTNSFNVVNIDFLTGRARVETPPIQ